MTFAHIVKHAPYVIAVALGASMYLNLPSLGQDPDSTTIRPARLLVDLTHRDGKAYLVDMHQAGNVATEVVPGFRLKWQRVDAKGRILCIKSAGEVLSLLRIDVSSGKTETLNEGLLRRIPSPFEGDLACDGTRICYVVQEGDASSLIILDLATGETQNVHLIQGALLAPSWSPDGQKIVYYVKKSDYGPDEEYSLYVSELREGEWRHRELAPPGRLSRRGGAIIPSAPIWACNGEMLVFEARYRDDERGPQTYVVRTDGSGLSRIAGFASGPSALPDGTGVLYVEDKDVRLWDSRTKRSRRLFATEQQLHYPRMAPAGDKVAASTGQGDIVVLSSDGKDRRVVFRTGTEAAYKEFTWLPLESFSDGRSSLKPAP